MDFHKAGQLADLLISREVGVQDQMWGVANERADATEGQMVRAAVAQATIVGYHDAVKHDPDEEFVSEDELIDGIKEDIYPKGWTGFRNYGSDVANLVVAAAYLRSEIKRRLAAGEDYTRTKRGEPYRGDQPAMSSDIALQNVAPDHLPPDLPSQ